MDSADQARTQRFEVTQPERFDPEIDFAIFCSKTWIGENDVWQAIIDLGVPAIAQEVGAARPDLNKWLVAHIIYNEALNRSRSNSMYGLND